MSRPPHDSPNLVDDPRTAAAEDLLPDPLADETAEPDPDDADRLPSADLALDDESAAPAAVRRGVEAIRAVWKSLPLGPGVYRMLAADGEVLYVGKARSLKRRVASYTRAAGHSGRIARVVAATATMAFVSTRTETEALLLEANYIKQMRPRFNVLMRDDKSFPYIFVTGDHEAPQLTKHRGARNRKGDYFGPFANVGAVNRTLSALQRAFLLRTCTDSFFENRTRPCLLHQIKRCSAPCTGEISVEDYAQLVRETRSFLSGRSRAVRERLAADMAQASDALEFERAARLRDRIAALSAIQGTQGINPKSVEEADVFAICEQAGQFCIEVFFFRSCQNWGNRTYFPRADRSLSQAEVLDSFLAQFYQDKPAPRLVLLSHEVESAGLLAEALSLVAGHKVEVAVPQRGEKKDLVDHAAQNGRETLGRKLSETATQEKLLGALAVAFGVEHPMRRVEVYDNSHIMGTNAVGAMIVAGAAGFMKTHYRTFNIKDTSLTPGDDFGMMREVLRRRFSRLLKEAPRPARSNPFFRHSPSDRTGVPSGHPMAGEEGGPRSGSDAPVPGASSPATGCPEGTPVLSDGLRREKGLGSQASRIQGPPESFRGHQEATPLSRAAGRGREAESAAEADEGGAAVSDPDVFPAWPDLILIDGGKGQLEAVRSTLEELGATGVAIVGIAKGPDRNAGRETFFVPGREGFKLSPRDPALYFVQRLRDEAHRFAIGTHRARRKKELTRSPLDEIGGIGPARKRALLHAFGTAKAIARAALPDLERVPGINAATAKVVYDFFHERTG